VKIRTEKSLYRTDKSVRIVKEVTFERYDSIKLMFEVNLAIICSNLKLTANNLTKQYLCTHHSTDHVIVNTFPYMLFTKHKGNLPRRWRPTSLMYRGNSLQPFRSFLPQGPQGLAMNLVQYRLFLHQTARLPITIFLNCQNRSRPWPRTCSTTI